MNDPFALWGCGHGFARRLHPAVRIPCGLLLLTAILVAPLRQMSVFTGGMAITAAWCLLTGIPRKTIMKLAVVSVVFFLPFLLLAPWMTVEKTVARPMIDKFTIAGIIACRGACGLFITTATIALLPLAEVQSGLALLPLPKAIKVLLLQLINQTMLLAGETFRIITVMRMRGAAGQGGMRVLFSLPVVWMGRILFRAERVAGAMTIRGYAEEAVTDDRIKLTRSDFAALTVAAFAAIVSIAMRLKGYV